MARFSFWSSIVFFTILFPMLTSAKGKQKPKPHQIQKFPSVEAFVREFMRKYGSNRTVEGPFTFQGIKNVRIVDKVTRDNGSYVFVRLLAHAKGVMKDHRLKAILKIPQNLDDAHLDSTKWEVDHSKLDFTSDSITILEELFASGGVDITPYAPRADILLFGLGSGYLSSYIHQTYPLMRIKVHETDAQLIDIVRKWFGFQEDGCLKLLTGSLRANLRKLISEHERFNVIVVDVCANHCQTPTPLCCPHPDFYNETIMRDLNSLLKSKGALVVSLSTPEENDYEGRMRGALTVWQKSIGVFGDCLPQYALFQKPIIIMTCINHRRDPEWRNIYQRLHGYQNIMSIPVL